MQDITIDRGLYTEININLSQYSFVGVSKVVFTIKNHIGDEDAIVKREFTTAQNHLITITPEESEKIELTAMYDFDEIRTNGDVFKITENGVVKVRCGVGG